MTLSRRDFLKGVGAAGVTGALTYKGLEHLFSPYKLPKEAYTSRVAAIERAYKIFKRNPHPTKEAGVWDLAEKPVLGDSKKRSRAQYIHDFFLSHSDVSSRFPSKAPSIPKSIRKTLSTLVVGQVAQESKYHNGLVSRVKARSLWQLMPNFVTRDAGRSLEDLKHLKNSTEIAFYRYQKIYQRFLEGIDFKGIKVPPLDIEDFQRHFGLSDTQMQRFLALAMVQSYQTGPRRMLEIMHWFRAHAHKTDIEKLEDKTERGLFFFMIESAYRSKKFPGFGTESREYVVKVLGATKAAAAKKIGITASLSFSPLATPSSFESALSQVQKSVREKILPLLGGYLAGEIVGRTSMSLSTKSKAPFLKVKREALKEAFKRKFIPLITAASIAGTALSAGIHEKIKGVIPDLPSFTWIHGDTEEISFAEAKAYYRSLRDKGFLLASSRKGLQEDGVCKDLAKRTCLVGIKKDILESIVTLLDTLKIRRPIIITGAAEAPGHSRRTHGHDGGFAVDLRSARAAELKAKILTGSQITSPTSRELFPSHPLLTSGLLIGNKIFRYRGKYMLFGLKREGRYYVVYFDSESHHKHLELIPWEDYDVENQETFVKKAKLPPRMKGIWRAEVRDYLRAQLR